MSPPPDDELYDPPRSQTHNWPRYQSINPRKKIVRHWPLSPPELEVLPSSAIALRSSFPICGGKNTPRFSPEEQQSPDRPAYLLCRKRAGEGTVHEGYGPCSKHGGNTANVRKGSAMEAGRHLIERYKAEQTLFGGDPDLIQLTPQQALMEEVRRSVAMVRYLQSQISTWNPGAGDLGALPALTDETTRGQGTPTDAAEWLRLYREERAHMVRVCKMTIDAGVDIALLALEQQKGVLLASAVREILDQLSLSPEQAQRVPEVVPSVLMKFSTFEPDVQSPTIQGQLLREVVVR